MSAQLHEQEEIVSMWGPDAPVAPPALALRYFTLAFSSFAGFLGFLYYVHPEMPAIRRDYPFDGLVKELGGLEENKVWLCSGWYHVRAQLTSCLRPGRRQH